MASNELSCRCVYFARSTKTCDYLLQTGHRRGCPYGAGCEKRLTKEAEKKMAKFFSQGDNHERALQMYKDGKSDIEIGKTLGCSGVCVGDWRKQQGLPSNFSRKNRPEKPEDQRDEIRVELIGHKEPEPAQEPVSKKADMVNHPPHYTQGGIECIDAIAAAVSGLTGYKAYCIANVIKYVWRFRFKNGLEDLKKARWYLDKVIEEVEENGINV